MSTDDAICWDAFGSDSDSDDSVVPSSTANPNHELEAIADTISLEATQHFAHLIKSSGVPVSDRLIGISNHSTLDWGDIIKNKLFSHRGISAVVLSDTDDLHPNPFYDAAVVWHTPVAMLSCNSYIRKSLVPGGLLWIISSQNDNAIEFLSNDVWDIETATTVHRTSSYYVTRIQKRACLINSWSCPWMDKTSVIPDRVRHGSIASNTQPNETYLQYEQRVACELTICTSAAERTRDFIATDDPNKSGNLTILTNINVEKAVAILREHGFVIIKGLLSPDQTLPWGDAVLADFQDAVDRLKCDNERPVNLMNPHQVDHSANGRGAKAVFEPLSYKEMSMREDLRVDLRAGPAMATVASSSANLLKLQDKEVFTLPIDHNVPYTIDSDMTGTASLWRFHPSIIAILKALFNPKDDKLSKGNFGRWNFGGLGPDGSPQPFRIGPIGSVISCPGSGDQAIHADTPHLFEHLDSLPCHYCNIFTPGFTTLCDEKESNYFKHEFDHDGSWTGNTTMGGTALVMGSHKLSVTAALLGEDDTLNNADSFARKQLLQLQTIRPALDAGDVLIFDNRTLHYGLANTSSGDRSGVNFNAGRRPMLYLNVTQSWFHDPKNWDDRKSIFD